MNSDDDQLLFQNSIGKVKPLIQDKVGVIKTANKQNSQIRQQAAQHFSEDSLVEQEGIYLSFEHVYMIKSDEIVSVKKAGVQKNVFKKFRMGRYSFGASLDLHGRTLKQARDDLIYFIDRCYQLNIRAAIVIHGKGELSRPQAQLKSHVSTWLPQFDQVLAIHTAQIQHGGAGALYVMIKKKFVLTDQILTEKY